MSKLISRDVNIETDSGSIAGVLCVQDELRLSSQSGSIEANIFLNGAASMQDNLHRGSLTPAVLITENIVGDQRLYIQPLFFERRSMLSGMENMPILSTPDYGNSEYLYLLASEHRSELGTTYIEAGP